MGSRELGPQAPFPSPPTRLTIVTHGTKPATTPPPDAVHFLQPCSHSLVLIHRYTYALSLGNILALFQVNSSSINKVVHTFSYLKKIYINKPPFRDVHYPIVCQKPTFSTAKAAIFTAVQQCTAGQYSVQIVNDSISSATAKGSTED